MNQKVIILPSVMCCTPAEMEPYVRGFEEGGVDAIHFDVMDGHYVPNIMMGVRDYQFLKSITDMPVDIHLMCTEPEMFLEYLKPQPKDWVSFHPEVARNPYRFLMSIRERGCRAGIVLSPGEPVSWVEEMAGVLDFVLVMAVNPGFAGQKLIPQGLDKIRDTRKFLDDMGYPQIEIEVDGNVSWENIPKMAAAGTDLYVAGTSSLFNDKVPVEESVKRFRSLI